MKKEQTRNVPYPVYPTYPGMNPMMMGPMPYGYPSMNPMGVSQMGMSGSSCSSNTTGELSSLKEEVDNLKKRVSYLENNLLSNYNNNYNSSNYQVM